MRIIKRKHNRGIKRQRSFLLRVQGLKRQRIKSTIECKVLTKGWLNKIRCKNTNIKIMKSFKQIRRSWKETRLRMKSFEIILISCRRLEAKEEGLTRQSGDLRVILRQFLRPISRAITSPQLGPTSQPRSCSTKSTIYNTSKTSKPQRRKKVKRDWTRSWCPSSLRSLIQVAQLVTTHTLISSVLVAEATRKTTIPLAWFLSSAIPRWIRNSFTWTSTPSSTLKIRSVQGAAMWRGTWRGTWPIPLSLALCLTDRLRSNRWRPRRTLRTQARIAAQELRVTEAQIIRSTKSSHRSATSDSACLPTSNSKSWARRISKITTRIIRVSWTETRGAFERILEATWAACRILDSHKIALRTHSPIRPQDKVHRYRATGLKARRSASSEKSSKKKPMRMSRIKWPNHSYNRRQWPRTAHQALL